MVTTPVQAIAPSQELTASRLAPRILRTIQQSAQGQLRIQSTAGHQWTLVFRDQQLLWVSSSEHRYRRWQRLLNSVRVSPTQLQLRDEERAPLWEPFALEVLIQRQQLTSEQAIAARENYMLEVLFDILYFAEEVNYLHFEDTLGQLASLTLQAPRAVDTLMTRSYRSMKDWRLTRLGHSSPNQAPVILSREQLLLNTSNRKSYETILTIANGRFSLRDVSVTARKDLMTLACILTPYIQRDMIRMQAVNDIGPPEWLNPSSDPESSSSSKPSTTSSSPSSQLPSPSSPSTSSSASPSRSQGIQVKAKPPKSKPTPPAVPLILCIDDSPQIGYLITQLLQPLGYRVLALHESQEAVSVALRQKPDLILLDLVMPIFNGYELCGHLRRVDAFKATPIIMLTGNDGVLDRVRAKMVGSTAFLGKPIDEEKLVGLIQQYLPLPVAKPQMTTLPMANPQTPGPQTPGPQTADSSMADSSMAGSSMAGP